MRAATRAGYLLSGAMLTNSLPHVVIALTGRRNITPFGRDSSAAVNAIWAAMNFAGGCLLARRMDRRADAQAERDGWLLPMIAGELCWAAFGVIYETRRRRTAPSSATSGAPRGNGP